MKVKVTGGWSLGLEDQEKRYTDGDVFDAPDDLAQAWIANGQAVAVKGEKAAAPKAKAVKAAKNKAVTTSANKSFTSAPTVTGKPVGPK